MTVCVEQLSLLNAVCLCTTDGEVKHKVDIGNGSSVEIVNEFGYLSLYMLSVDGDAEHCCDRQHSHWLVSVEVTGLFPKMFSCCCKEKFITHVYRVVCYT